MRLSIILILIYNNFSLNAQQASKLEADHENRIRFGIHAGVNMNKIEGKTFKQEFKYNYQVGAFVLLNLTQKLGLQPEISFGQTSSELSNDATVIYDDIFLGGEQKKAKLNFLKIAPLLNIDIGPSQRVKLQAGPQWGMLLNEAVDSLKSPGTIFRKGEFSLLGGVLIQLPLVHIGARYELGLSNINDIDKQDLWKNRAWQFFVGVTF